MRQSHTYHPGSSQREGIMLKSELPGRETQELWPCDDERCSDPPAVSATSRQILGLHSRGMRNAAVSVPRTHGAKGDRFSHASGQHCLTCWRSWGSSKYCQGETYPATLPAPAREKPVGVVHSEAEAHLLGGGRCKKGICRECCCHGRQVCPQETQI